VIHEKCPEPGALDAGRSLAFGDAATAGGALQLGCKAGYSASCSTGNFNNSSVGPIGIGAPCLGCTEKERGFGEWAHSELFDSSGHPPTLISYL